MDTKNLIPITKVNIAMYFRSIQEQKYWELLFQNHVFAYQLIFESSIMQRCPMIKLFLLVTVGWPQTIETSA